MTAALLALMAVSQFPGADDTISLRVVDQNETPKITARPKLLHTEIDTVGWALNALATYDQHRQPFVRFVALPGWASPSWIGAVNMAVNLSANHARVVVPADVHAGGWLLAYDFARLVPDPFEREKVIAVWDSLATRDSKYHLSELNIDENLEGRVALLAPHLQEALARHAADADKSLRLDVLMTQLTASTGAIYPADFVIDQCLSSTYGKYPEFRLIDFDGDGKSNGLQTRLKRYGYFFEFSVKSRGEKGAILLVSDITRKSRAVFSVFGTQSRTPAWGTFDFQRKSARPDEQFIRNLIDPFALSDASEWFVPLPNGLVEYLLADGKGNIVRTAPPDVAIDHQKPLGGELEMGISCVTCHYPHTQYQPIQRNDLNLILGSNIDYLGDEISVSGVKLTREEAVDIVSGRYGEELERVLLPRSRQDFNDAVFRLAPHPVEAGGLNATQAVGELIQEIWYRYRYATIDADRACLELGVEVPPGQGRKYLQTLTPPSGQEDIVIALLKQGVAVNRHDFDAIYTELARRAVAGRESIRKELEK